MIRRVYLVSVDICRLVQCVINAARRQHYLLLHSLAPHCNNQTTKQHVHADTARLQQGELSGQLPAFEVVPLHTLFVTAAVLHV